MFKINIFDKHYNKCNITDLQTNETKNIDPTLIKGFFDEDIITFCNNKIKLITKSNKRNNIVGILKINNKTIYGSKNKIFYIFEPFDKKLPNFLVASKFTDFNKFAQINFLEWTTDIPRGEIVSYFGNTKSNEALSTALSNYYIKNIKSLNFKMINFNNTDSNNTDSNSNFIFNDYDDIFSIDPDNCKDIDDVISFKKIADDKYNIGIHITDITYYLQKSPYIFKILHDRVSTIYTKYKNTNLLPNKFATDICSLHPNKSKKVISLIIETDGKKINNYNFMFNTIISKKAYSYDEANIKLKKHPIINITKNISRNLLKNYNVDKWDYHNVIEVLMIITNHYAAKILIEQNISIPLRTQKESSIINYITSNNELNSFLNIYNSNSAEYVNSSTQNLHHTIGLNCYTHFTSPIRRYIDIYIHFNISIILGRKFDFNIKLPDTDYINNINNNIKLLSYDLNKLSLIDKITTDFELVSGYIIKVLDNINSVIIYVPKYKITLLSNIVPNNMMDLFNFDINKNNDVCIHNKKGKFIVNLFTEYEFKIIYQNNKETINEKICIYFSKINLYI